MRIDSSFASGNGVCVDISPEGRIDVEIEPDQGTEIRQWFCFDLYDARDRDCRIRLVNAGRASFQGGWKDYRACASADGTNWFRVETEFDGQALTIRHRPRRNRIRLAYFAPYTMARHYRLLARCAGSTFATVDSLGRSLDGQKISLVTIGNDAAAAKPICWFIARQHPGEAMAEWWIEGMLERLLDPRDQQARRLREQAVIHIVPNMNPDGTRRGHLRTNAAGQDLNRAWAEPSLETTPEVFLVRRRMAEGAVDFCLDVHGDETLPYSFLTGGYGIPSMTERQASLRERYIAAMLVASDEFQTEFGYPKAREGKANLSICSNYLAEAFGGVCFTLEQPFKDNALKPQPDTGWSPARARKMGADSLTALSDIVPRLRK